MTRKRTFWRFLLWSLGVEAIIYIAYVIDVFTSHGGQDWFQHIVFASYGQIGVHLVDPFVSNSWAGLGILILLSPLIGMLLFGLLIAIIAALARMTRDA